VQPERGPTQHEDLAMTPLRNERREVHSQADGLRLREEGAGVQPPQPG
jgi:hypothetical protein